MPKLTSVTRPQTVLAALASIPAEDRIDRVARRALEKYSPVYVVIDRHHDILRFSGGEAGRYLEPSSGAASLNLFVILRKVLRPVVRITLQKVLSTKKVVVRAAVLVKVDGENRAITVIVEPLAEAGMCAIVFRDDGLRATGSKARAALPSMPTR